MNDLQKAKKELFDIVDVCDQGEPCLRCDEFRMKFKVFSKKLVDEYTKWLNEDGKVYKEDLKTLIFIEHQL